MHKNFVIGICLSVLAAFPIRAQQPAPDAKIQNPPPAQHGTDDRPFVVKIMPNAESPDKIKEDKAERDQKRIIDEKLADRTGDLAQYTWWLFIATGALAGITGILVLVSIYQSKEARKATQIAADTLKLAPQIERAYVSGGGARIVTRRISDGQQEPGETIYREHNGVWAFAMITNQFEVHINNHGKTPARIHHLRIGFFDAAADPPAEPPLGNFKPLVDSIGPGTQSRPVKVINIPEGYDRTAICGRFYWRDIWDREWSTGFVYEISAPNSVNNGSIYLLAPPAYTDDCEVKDKPWEAAAA